MDDYGLNDLTPEQLNQLMQLGVMDDKQHLLMKQMDTADTLRNAPQNPNGQMVGRVYVANPLGQFADSAGRVLADRKYKGLEQNFNANLDQQTAGRQAFLDALRRQPQNGFSVGDY